MQWNRIARKRVHRDHIEIVRMARGKLALQLYSGVAQHPLRPRLRILQISKPGVGDGFNGGIDFVETKDIAGAPPGGQRASAKADPRDPPYSNIKSTPHHTSG